MAETKKQGMKVNVGRTFLIGLGLFAVSVCGSVYNAYVPIIIRDHVPNAVLLGFIMAVDNIFAALVQPVFGKLSDMTRTKIGKRMPYILIGAPIGAVLFMLIPWANSLASTMAVIIAYNFVMMAWHVPAISLMPDLTPSPLRSQANGIINVMGGLGNVVAFLFGGMLFNLGGMPMPFLVSGIAMIVSTVILGLTIRENKIRKQLGFTDDAPVKKEKKGKVEKEKVKLSGKELASLICLIGAVFMWGFGFNATETFFSLYAVDKFPGFTAGDASMVMTAFPLSFLVVAIPAGFLAGKIGRKKSIQIGLAVDIVCIGSVYFMNDIRMVLAAFIVGGMAWALVNVNALPMVLELAGPGKIGVFTACYYFFSDPAYIISPIAFGVVYELTKNYANAFLFTAISFVIAFVFMLFVRHGEAADEPAEGAEDAKNGL